MIQIKRATSSNANELALLARVTYRESHGHFIEDKQKLFNYLNEHFLVESVEQDLKNPEVMFDILYYKNFPVGYTKLVSNAAHEYDIEKRKIRLERIYILEEFIPLKLGKLLLDHSIQQAFQLNFEHLWLSVYIKNKRALRFYEKNGFRKVGCLDFMVDGKSYENHVLLKELTL